MKRTRIRSLIVIGVAGAGLLASAPVQAQSSSAPVSPQSAQDVVRTNQAIAAYLAGDRPTARELFQAIIASEPNDRGALYFLGLISLENGLELAQAASALPKDDPESGAKRSEARAAFSEASTYFERITQLADLAARPVEAALLLGIAQLGGDDPSGAQALELNQRARDTLHAYVTETDVGATDRFGYFYLAVAHYRLADEYRKREDRGAVADNLAQTRINLDKALEYARTAQTNGEIDAAEYAYFDTVHKYYNGLMLVQEGAFAPAVVLLQEVQSRGAGEVSNNANTVLNKLQSVEVSTPTRMQFLQPPVGPLEFSANFTIGNWYDTNVILLGEDTILPRGISRKSDYRYGVDAEFNLTRYITKSEAPWLPGESLFLGIGAVTQNYWHPHIGEFDLNNYIGRTFANWQFLPDMFLGVQYDYSYTFLGHDPYIGSSRITPIFSKLWREKRQGDEQYADERARTDVFYTYDYRDYRDKISDYRLNRDGEYNLLGIRQSVNIMKSKDLWGERPNESAYFPNRWMNAYVGYLFRDERTGGREFDLWGHSLIAGVEVPLPWRFSFEFDAEWLWDHYNSRSIFDYRGNERRDMGQRYDFGLSYQVVARGESQRMPTLEVKLRGGVALTFQDSNITDRLGEQIYEYDRAIYGLSLNVGF